MSESLERARQEAARARASAEEAGRIAHLARAAAAEQDQAWRAATAPLGLRGRV